MKAYKNTVNDLTYSESCILSDQEKLEIRSAIEQLNSTVFTNPIENIMELNIRSSPDTQNEKIANSNEVIHRGHYTISASFQRDIVVTLQNLQAIQDINQQKIFNISVIPRQSDSYVVITFSWSRGIVNRRSNKRKEINTCYACVSFFSFIDCIERTTLLGRVLGRFCVFPKRLLSNLQGPKLRLADVPGNSQEW